MKAADASSSRLVGGSGKLVGGHPSPLHSFSQPITFPATPVPILFSSSARKVSKRRMGKGCLPQTITAVALGKGKGAAVVQFAMAVLKGEVSGITPWHSQQAGHRGSKILHQCCLEGAREGGKVVMGAEGARHHHHCHCLPLHLPTTPAAQHLFHKGMHGGSWEESLLLSGSPSPSWFQSARRQRRQGSGGNGPRNGGVDHMGAETYAKKEGHEIWRVLQLPVQFQL